MSVQKIGSSDWEEKVQESDTPMMVEFMLPTCPACQQMEPVVEEVAEEYKDKLEVYQVNVKQDRQLALEYGVKSTPTFKIFYSGNPVSEQVGAVYPKILKKAVEHALKRGKDCMEDTTQVYPEITGYV